MPTQRFTLSVRVNTGGLDDYLSKLPGKVNEAALETGRAIQARASQVAPKDTTALSNSIYVNDSTGESDYSVRAGAASSLRRSVVMVPEVRSELVISPSGGREATYTVVVGVAVPYGIHQEFGTRFHRAQPYLIPSTEPQRDEFVTRVTQAAQA